MDCSGCYFWKKVGSQEQIDIGQCRINEPFPDPGSETNQGLWPLTFETDWCGCHFPIEEGEAEDAVE